MDPIAKVLLFRQKWKFKSEGAGPPRNKSGGPMPMRSPRFRHLWLSPFLKYVFTDFMV